MNLLEICLTFLTSSKFSFIGSRLYNVELLSLNGFFFWCRFEYTFEKIPASSFHLSDEKSLRLAHSVASSWNTSITVLKSLSKGNDWMLFLKVYI